MNTGKSAFDGKRLRGKIEAGHHGDFVRRFGTEMSDHAWASRENDRRNAFDPRIRVLHMKPLLMVCMASWPRPSHCFFNGKLRRPHHLGRVESRTTSTSARARARAACIRSPTVKPAELITDGFGMCRQASRLCWYHARASLQRCSCFWASATLWADTLDSSPIPKYASAIVYQGRESGLVVANGRAISSAL